MSDRRFVCSISMTVARELSVDHARIYFEYRIVFEVPFRALPDRSGEFLLIVLPEETRFDARGIIRGWNGWSVGIFVRQGNADRIPRLRAVFRKDQVELILQIFISVVVSRTFAVCLWRFLRARTILSPLLTRGAVVALWFARRLMLAAKDC